jgi:hypothetical protein
VNTPLCAGHAPVSIGLPVAVRVRLPQQQEIEPMSSEVSSAAQPDGTVIYQLNAAFQGAQGRIFEYAQNQSAARLAEGANGNVTLQAATANEPSNKVIVANGTASNPVYVGICINDPCGTPLKPVAILVRRGQGQGGNGNPQGRGTFPVATPLADGFTLVLTDNEDDKANFEFDVLFTDGAGNYGWLDPKLQNV